jgi:oligopeptide transport system substrate-binding protein
MRAFSPRPSPRFISLAWALLAACLLSACSRPQTPDATRADAASEKVLRIGNGTEPQELDPHVVSGVSEHRIISALLEGLVIDHPSGEGVAPGVAERWESSADGLVWTFHLRSDARWSNGDPVTAQDFLNAFQRLLTPSLAAEYAYKLHHVIGAEEFNRGTLADFAQTGFSAPDSRTLVLRLKHRVPYLLEALKHYSWFPIHLPTVAAHGPVDRKGNRWTRPDHYVGNGPFVLKEWRPDQFISVERSPTYWDAASTRLDRIVFHAVTDENTEERMFRSGQLDATYTLPSDQIEPYRSRQPEVLRIAPYYGTYFYRLNTTRPPLDDARVRRALAIAIDREAIVSAILRAGQSPAYNFTPTGFGFTPDRSLSSDVAEARRLLAEAGFPEGRGLRRIEILYNTMDAHKRVAEAVQQMWKTRLGIDVSLRNEEWQVYLDTQRKLDYDVARAGWIGDYPDPQTFLDLWTTGGGNNDTGYSNPHYDRLLASALAVPGDDARMAVYRQLENIIVHDVPVIPLYFYKRVYLISPRVRNWTANLLDHRAWKFIDVAP